MNGVLEREARLRSVPPVLQLPLCALWHACTRSCSGSDMLVVSVLRPKRRGRDMGWFATIAASIAIAAGLLLPVAGPSLSREKALMAIMALSLGAAAVLAAHWWRLVRRRMGQLAAAADPVFAIQSLMRESCRWLQPFRPDFSQLRPSASKNVYDRIAGGCLGPMVLGVATLAVAIAVMVSLDDALGSRGFFGQFLQTSAGRALAGGFAAYLLISSFALIFLGVIARFHRGTTE